MRIKINSNTSSDVNRDSWFKRFVLFLNKDYSLKIINDAQKEVFFNDLFVLMNSGLDIRTALDILEKESNKIKLKDKIRLIKENVTNGIKFSDALLKSGQFNSYVCINVQIGEESGSLLEVFSELAFYFKRKQNLRKQLISIISYPSFVLLVTVGIVWFMLSVVVPMFSDVFGQFGGELPKVTQYVISMSNFMQQYYWVALIIFLLGGIAFSIVKNKVWFNALTSLLILNIPVFGTLVQKVQLSRFSLSMKMMLKSNIPVLTAVNLIDGMTSFHPVSMALKDLQKGLFDGKSLHYCLAQHSIFPSRFVTLIRVGEEVNQLPKMFEKIETQLTEEITYETEIMGRIIEPVMIIFIGLFVGMILISMYLPLFELSTAIN